MHDHSGRSLKVGDIVFVPMVITSLTSGEDFCNVGAKSIYGRRPDDQKETFSAINTGVMLRSNVGDINEPKSWQEEPVKAVA